MASYDNEIHELRQKIAKLERQIEFILKNQGLTYRDEPNQSVNPEIIDLMRRGNKIQAIKIYREETGVGLKQAKDFVESLDL